MTSQNFESLHALQDLVSQVKQGKCILFLGAGIHAAPSENSKYIYPAKHRPPIGSELAVQLAKACDYQKRFPNESLHDLQRIAMCFETTYGLGRNKLIDFVSKKLRSGTKPSPLLKMLASLSFRIIITTNYDRLMESALTQLEKDPKVLVYNPGQEVPTEDISEDPDVERPLIFKMHGDLDHRDSIVITDEDYITFVQRMSDKEPFHPIPQTVRYRMQRWPTLFIGYSLRDYNLRLLFRTLRWQVDPANYPPAYSVDPHPDPLILQVYQNERRFITFIPQDSWTFIPWLYREIHGKEFQI